MRLNQLRCPSERVKPLHLLPVNLGLPPSRHCRCINQSVGFEAQPCSSHTFALLTHAACYLLLPHLQLPTDQFHSLCRQIVIYLLRHQRPPLEMRQQHHFFYNLEFVVSILKLQFLNQRMKNHSDTFLNQCFAFNPGES